MVFANNDDMALGAIDALKESDVEHWPLVVGIDGTDVALDAVDRHELYGTVLNDAKGQARAMLARPFPSARTRRFPMNLRCRTANTSACPTSRSPMQIWKKSV